MPLPMATVVTTTLVAALGGVPGALACAGSSFIHHHTHALQPDLLPRRAGAKPGKRNKWNAGHTRPTAPTGHPPLDPKPR